MVCDFLNAHEGKMEMECNGSISVKKDLNYL